MASTPTSGLRWPEPSLENPITIDLKSGQYQHTLKSGQDYIVKLPAGGKVGSTGLIGGRNIVVIGGKITVPKGDANRRGLYFKDQTGTIHVEGADIEVAEGAEGDDIAVNAPDAIVQVQNCWLLARGTRSGFHGDVFQPWGGVKEWRVDRVTGYSNYQAFQVPIDLGPIERGVMSRTDLHSFGPQTSDSGGYLFWALKGSDASMVYPIALSEVYAEGRPGRNEGKIVWPDVDHNTAASVVKDGNIIFPKLPQIDGYIKLGKPADGEFAPRSMVGLNYDRAKFGTEPTPEPKVIEVTVRPGETVVIRGVAN